MSDLGRDLNKLVYLDYDPISFWLSPQNVIPIS